MLQSLSPTGFNHYEQSLRIVDVLERDRQGLNLTWEVRDGIARHSKGKHGLPVGAPPEHRASTIEGQVARVADIVAYVNHDVDDAVRAGILHERDLPAQALAVLGRSASERIGRMVTDVVEQTLAGGTAEIRMSAAMLEATLALRDFLFEAVYENDAATAEFAKAEGILGGLWEQVQQQPDGFLDPRTIEAEGLARGDPGLHRRDDRPLRGGPVRAAVHPQAVGRPMAGLGALAPRALTVPRWAAAAVLPSAARHTVAREA